MPQTLCQICKSEFYAKPNHIKLGWGKYCSRICKHEAQKTGKAVNCFTCGKGIYRTQKDLKGSKSKKYFCNKSCFAIWKNELFAFGPTHFNWKHGKSAYRNIMARNNILQVCVGCGLKDKRILLVHHIDHNRLNNKLDNLKWLCRNCHYLEHNGKTI